VQDGISPVSLVALPVRIPNHFEQYDMLTLVQLSGQRTTRLLGMMSSLARTPR